MALSAPSTHTGVAADATNADAAICAACVAEIFDPFSRRFRYPLTHCKHCGPRLELNTGVPHEQPPAPMATLALCADCRAEYESPADRHFQARAIACHACGPRLRLQRMDGRAFALDSHTFLDDCDAAGTLLAKGHVLAIQGLGGYQLACDATRPEAVARLRALKRREAQPFALMVAHLDAARAWCEVSDAEAQALQSQAAPTVLLRRRANIAAPGPADAVAPGLDSLGLMLPCTGVHHLVLRRMRRPIVLTSSGLGDEPQAITREASGLRAGAGGAGPWRRVEAQLVHAAPRPGRAITQNGRPGKRQGAVRLACRAARSASRLRVPAAGVGLRRTAR